MAALRCFKYCFLAVSALTWDCRVSVAAFRLLYLLGRRAALACDCTRMIASFVLPSLACEVASHQGLAVGDSLSGLHVPPPS